MSRPSVREFIAQADTPTLDQLMDDGEAWDAASRTVTIDGTGHLLRRAALELMPEGVPRVLAMQAVQHEVWRELAIRRGGALAETGRQLTRALERLHETQRQLKQTQDAYHHDVLDGAAHGADWLAVHGRELA